MKHSPRAEKPKRTKPSAKRAKSKPHAGTNHTNKASKGKPERLKARLTKPETIQPKAVQPEGQAVGQAARIKVKKPGVPGKVLQAWREILISLGRFPAGTPKTQKTPYELIKLLAKAEQNHIAELREVFTQRRSELTLALLSQKKDLVAYLLGFHLANTGRLQACLERLEARGFRIAKLCAASEIQVFDLGCGSGAMAQIWLSHLQTLRSKTLHFHLVDNHKVLLEAAKTMLTSMEPAALVRTYKAGMESFTWPQEVPGAFSIYNLGYLWNELEKNPKARRQLLKRFADLVARQQQALLVLQEPATQDQSRSAMELRDQLCELGYLPLYPCPTAAPCPMLERSRDWCYSEFDWRKPMEQDYIDKLTEAGRAMIATTTFIFLSPAAKPLLRAGVKKSVVVGRPVTKDKNPRGDKFSYLVCSPSGELTKKGVFPSPQTLKRGELMPEAPSLVAKP